MRKLSAILFITLFALLCLFGCNPSSPGNNGNANDTTDTTDKTDNDNWTYTNAHYANPLKFYKQDGSEYFVTVADPDILRDDESGYFYMYCTNTQCEMGDKGILYDRGPIFRSENLVDWTWVGSVFDGHHDALNWHDKNAGVWAPSVIKVGDRYNYYYSLSLWGDSNPGIGVATSPTPYGPWTHYGKLLDQEMTGVRNGIDPQPFYDGDDLYIVWGSFYGIAATLLTDDGTELFYGDSVKDHITYLIDDNTDGKMNVNINYEGSYIIKRNGKLYYFGSQGTCLSGKDSTYRVRVGVCDNFLEKFATHDGITLDKEPYGEEVISPSDKVVGVGHNTVVQDFAGDYWLFYHGFYLDGENPGERIAFMDKLLWDENDMPYVEGRKASIGKDILGPTVVKHN